MEHSDAMEAELELARLKYNALYSSRPIKRIGDTLGRQKLIDMSPLWEDGDRPLPADVIEEIEAETPEGALS